MTVGDLIKKLASYELDQQVFLVSLADDSGDSDTILNEDAIDEKDGHILICHSASVEF